MRVLCVDDGPTVHGFSSGLVKWREYTITARCTEEHANGDEPSVFLSEKVGADLDEALMCGCYRLSRFRPIREIDVRAMFKIDALEPECL